MNRGYAGFYNGHYLRSSYEYAYAKYHDFHSIPWSYEDHNYDIGYKIYKPDFFFYERYGKLEKIVEIKSRNEASIIEARKALRIIEERFNVGYELLSYIVTGTPLNKIRSTIAPLLDEIQKKFGVKDLRVISKAVFGEDRGRKELIKFMNDVCNEKIC